MLTAVAACLIAALLCFINGSWNPTLAALFFCAAVVEVTALRIMLDRNSALHRERSERTQLIDYLYRAVYGKPKAGSYLLSLQRAHAAMETGAMKPRIGRELKERLMGGTEADAESRERARVGATKQEAEAQISEYMLREKSRKGRVEEAAQRYATFNMFVSTVAPSFMIFAFIGSYVLSQSGSGLLFLSVGLLCAVPLFYSFGNMFMWRRLLG